MLIRITANTNEVTVRPDNHTIEIKPVVNEIRFYATGVYAVQGGGGSASEIEMRNNGTYIQWKLESETTWNNLIAIADLKGADGTNGTNGTNGKEIELQKTSTYIQWRYVGETWVNLVALADIKGEQGIQGVQGTTGATGVAGKTAYQSAVDGGYTGTESQFNTDLSVVSNKVDKVTGSSLIADSEISRLAAGKLVKTITTATLTVAGWSTNNQTVSVSGVTASNLVVVAPVNTRVNTDNYSLSRIICTAQGSGTLTFNCDLTPTAEITVNVLIYDN